MSARAGFAVCRFGGVLSLLTCMLLPAAVMAEEADSSDAGTQDTADAWQLPEPDTSRWGCRNCPFPEGWSGDYELGAGFVSDDSFGFGDYRGLEEEEAFPVVETDVLYRDDEAGYFEFRGEELGRDSRSLRAEGGRQGSYGVWFEFDQLPHYVSDDGRTVFAGAGSSSLGLPGGWVRADSTADMTALEGSLRKVEIEQERQSIGAGLDLLWGDYWNYDIRYQEDTREGTRVQGGSFLFRSALLPAPVDYRTERIDASVSYVRERWQFEAGLHTSMFTNDHDALTWENPFTSGQDADRGQLAQPPDNLFNQVSLSGSWRSRGSLAVSGRLAVGRMEQDENFLPTTTNGSLGASGPPRGDLDGKVDTRKLDLRVTGQPVSGLTARAEVFHDERDNRSPRDDYVQVVTDSLVSDARTNRPYSYERKGAEAELDYRVSSRISVSAEAGREEFERSLQEARETRTDRYALEFRGMLTERLNARIRRLQEVRDGSYQSLGLAGSNPDLRKFNQAQRDRDATRVAFDYLASDTVTLGLATEWADDEYGESDVGLVEASDRSVSVDLSATPVEGVTAYGFVSLQSVDAELRGADGVNGANWVADQDDNYRTIGLGLDVTDLPGGFTRGRVDVTAATGNTAIRVEKDGAGLSDFPDIETHLYTLNLQADRPFGEDGVLRLGYLVEHFSEEDFQRDGVAPDTIPGALTLGEGTPGYTVHVIQASLRYRF